MTSREDSALRELVRDVVRDELRSVVRELQDARPSPAVSPPVARHLDAREAAEVKSVRLLNVRVGSYPGPTVRTEFERYPVELPGSLHT